VPVEVKGVKELRSALLHFDADLKKQMDQELRAAMMPIRDAARGYVPSIPPGLRSWTKPPKKVVSSYRPFPRFDAAEIRKGIIYRSGANKANRNGFQSLFYIANTSAAGAIYETAGRKNPGGQPWQGPVKGFMLSRDHDFSHSTNPGAGAHFVGYMPPLYGKDKQRGRLIYRAWEEDQGKATLGVVKAIDKAIGHFNALTQNSYGLAA
jgi:hypothetical protein